MASLVDACVFVPASGGTGSFVVASAVTGWRTPAQASAVNGATYRYRAYSANQSQWEVGTGVYTAGSTTLTRAIILDSSNGGAAVNFTVPPAVALTAFAAEFPTAAQLAKVDFLSVTQAVDLDAMEASIASYGTAATKNTGTGAGNVPILDGSGLLDTAVLPAIAITDVFVVASQVAMLALSAQKGDIAIRSDQNKSYALSTNSPGTLGDWKELLTPTDAVLSVAGLTGAISAAGLKTALSIAMADITDASANGRSLVTAANYAAMKTLLTLNNVDNTSDATKNSATATLTSKRVTPRVTSITSSGTPTVNTDTCDFVDITALAAAITSMTTNLSGTPTTGQKLIVRFKDNGTARAIAWGASFAARGVALPTTTVISKYLTVGFIWDTVWGCVASAQEA